MEDIESIRFTELESVIDVGLKTFVDVGNALLEIRDSRLYRAQWGTFDEYCRERWGMAKSRAYQLIDAAQVSANVSTVVDILPVSERQARPLTRLEPEKQREAWQTAVETAPGGKVTATHVRSVVDTMIDPPVQRPSAKEEKLPEPAPRMDVHYSSDRHDWETPQPLFDLLNREFNFTLDVCATDRTAKCDEFFSPASDGLAQDWGSSVCWCNPPYGNQIKDWIAKAYDSAREGATVVCLVPARTDTRYWWEYCIRGEVRFLRGRLRFDGWDNSAPFPSAVVVFRPGVSADDSEVVWWSEWNGTESE